MVLFSMFRGSAELTKEEKSKAMNEAVFPFAGRNILNNLGSSGRSLDIRTLSMQPVHQTPSQNCRKWERFRDIPNGNFPFWLSTIIWWYYFIFFFFQYQDIEYATLAVGAPSLKKSKIANEKVDKSQYKRDSRFKESFLKPTELWELQEKL